MRYVKCGRCELNYMEEGERLCKVCLCAVSGEDDGEEDLEGDVCPFCEENILEYGEDKCGECLRRENIRADDEEREKISVDGKLIEVERNL